MLNEVVDDAWRELYDAAHELHQAIWMYGENNSFPPGLDDLPRLDDRLSAAIAEVHLQPGGNRMSVRLPDRARDGYTVLWDVAEGDEDKMVTLVAEGEKGDMHNKAPQKNNGTAGIFYPDGFVGSSHVEIRDEDGNVLDSGDIEIN